MSAVIVKTGVGAFIKSIGHWLVLGAVLLVVFFTWYITDRLHRGKEARDENVTLRDNAEDAATGTAAAVGESRDLNLKLDTIVNDLQETRNETRALAASRRASIRAEAPGLADRRVSAEFVRMFNRARGVDAGGDGKRPADDRE